MSMSAMSNTEDRCLPRTRPNDIDNCNQRNFDDARAGLTVTPKRMKSSVSDFERFLIGQPWLWPVMRLQLL